MLPPAPHLTNGYWIGNTGTDAFGITFGSAPFATYSVWGSTDLLDWLWLGSAAESPPGACQFSDVSATNWSQRFYRVTAP